MEEKFNILDNLKKTAKPSVPAGYYENFYSKLDLADDMNESAIGLNKKVKPEVPSDFFANFSTNLMDKIKEEEEKTIEPARVWPLKLVGFVTAVAACALIFFMIQPEDQGQVLADTTLSPDTELEEEEKMESYLAYLDEDEIVDFLIENEDIEITEEFTEAEEDEYYFLEEDLEELYFENL